jgi:hypothetical protein
LGLLGMGGQALDLVIEIWSLGLLPCLGLHCWFRMLLERYKMREIGPGELVVFVIRGMDCARWIGVLGQMK